MAVTNSFTTGCNNLGPLSFSSNGALNQNVSVVVPSMTTDQEFDIVYAFALLNSVFLYADGPLTLKTNATGSGGDEQTFDFASGIPLIWTDLMPAPNPFTSDCTKWYLTNGTGTDINLRGFVLSTPA